MTFCRPEGTDVGVRTIGGERDTVALPEKLTGHRFPLVADWMAYVDVKAGLAGKESGLAPVRVPPPLSSVTVYGGAPPDRTTVSGAEFPAQIVALPLKVASITSHSPDTILKMIP